MLKNIPLFLLLASVCALSGEEPVEIKKDTAAESTMITEGNKKTDTTPEKKEKAKKRKKLKLEDEQNESEKPPEKDPATYKLKNEEMIEDFFSSKFNNYDTGEHLMINIIMGSVTGAMAGTAIGFSVYNTETWESSRNNLYLYGGAGAIAGVVSAGIVTWFETMRKEQFTIGRLLMKYSWYGVFGGAMMGAAFGLIPYSNSENVNDLINYAGYGSAIGLTGSIVLFFFDVPDYLKIYAGPDMRNTGSNVLAFTFTF